jgi:hypothetical protein
MLKNEKENKMNDIYTGLIPLNDAKWKRKENEWYLYWFDTVKWC